MTDLMHARRELAAGRLAFVLVRAGRVLATGTQPGVAELLAAFDQLGPTARGSSLADKIVGHAVAVLALRAGVVAVTTPRASRTAVDLLAAHAVALEADEVVPQVLNHRGDGPCPLERLACEAGDPEQAVAKLRDFLAAQRAPA